MPLFCIYFLFYLFCICFLLLLCCIYFSTFTFYLFYLRSLLELYLLYTVDFFSYSFPFFHSTSTTRQHLLLESLFQFAPTDLRPIPTMSTPQHSRVLCLWTEAHLPCSEETNQGKETTILARSSLLLQDSIINL